MSGSGSETAKAGAAAWSERYSPSGSAQSSAAAEATRTRLPHLTVLAQGDAQLPELTAQFLSDPHVREREIVVEVPDAETGRIAMHNIIPRLSHSPGGFRRAAPGLGEHTAEILAELAAGDASPGAPARSARH